MNNQSSTENLFPDATRADIQGFITSGHKHLDHSAYLFLKFDSRESAARGLNAACASTTTAARWRPAPGEPKAPPGTALNLAFTAEGLRVLGLRDECMASFPREFLDGPSAASRARIMGDTDDCAPETWQFGGPTQSRIHALAIVSATSLDGLSAEITRLGNDLAAAPGASVLVEERGDRPEHGKEPFGFLDGIAQPEIRGIKPTGVRAGEFLLGHENEYGFHTPGPVVFPKDDPRSLLPGCEGAYRSELRDLGVNGSYVVYRKLAQDVAGFWRFLKQECVRQRGDADPRFMVWLAAKMVGRWPSGAPLVLAPDADDPALGERNDFEFSNSDPGGIACPLGSHIRRANPRDHILPAGRQQSLSMSARHRILRRGKPYGPELFDLRVLDRVNDVDALRAIVDLCDDKRDRGLQFLCVNASIKSQFEFIQQSWSNSSRFNGLVGNCDPLTGTAGKSGEPSCMHVPTGELAIRTTSMPRLVKARAAAYFFMPGMRALRYLLRES